MKGQRLARPPQLRLVRATRRSSAIELTADQRAVVGHESGRLRVLAGPGTGKTATLVEAVADRIERRGVPPEQILVLTFSRRAATELSDRIATRLRITVAEPLVRTVHSFAYSIVRAAAQRAGEPPPRLLEAGQADLMVRDLLTGHAEVGGGQWPAEFRAALGVPSFAGELRELMLRCAEQQVTPRRIAALGDRLGRPEWQAVAEFIDEYRDVSDLRSGTVRLGAALDQADLTVAALERLSDPAVLAEMRSRIRRVFVDEYQDVDPAQARLIELVSGGADELVVVGDPDQAIYGFRGSAPGVLQRLEVDHETALTTSRRMAPALVAATRRIAGLLPGTDAHRQMLPSPAAPGTTDGTVAVRILERAGQEATFVADHLRRAHLDAGIGWSQMALLLRSPVSTGDVFRRALAAAGVPVMAGATQSLAKHPLVAALLSVLAIGQHPQDVDPAAVIALLSSPLGGMDPLSLRALRRALRSRQAADGRTDQPTSSEMLAEIVLGARELPDSVPADLAEPLQQISTLVRCAVDHADDAAAETALWEVWRRSGLADHLVAASLGGRRDAEQADADLDAVVELFARAADLAVQLPSAGVAGLLEILADENISSPGSQQRSTDAVTVLSAHAAKGLEWDVVVVAGVQEETWPDLRPRASLLGMTELLDAAAGLRGPLAPTNRIAEERRLFYVAATRARRDLLVTAVDDDEHTPSRFLEELAESEQIARGWPREPDGRSRRSLTLPALVADLRSAVTGSSPRADAAAQVLASLAANHVPGSDPSEWYGLAALSSEEPLVAAGLPVSLSPSQWESARQCPLRTVLERHGGRADHSEPQLIGIAVHALAEGVAAGADDAVIRASIDEFLAAQDTMPPWELARTKRRMLAMYGALTAWLNGHRQDRQFAGSEVGIDLVIPVPGEHPVRLRGRVDWLSRDPDGGLIVTDFKTGRSVPTRGEMPDHAQLAAYQIAVALGGLDADTVADPAASATVAGAELVYLASGRPQVREQDAHDEATRQRWLSEAAQTAAALSGTEFTARTGSHCERCPVRSSCPVQPEGRQVTR